jgi:membrane associated rhomboid family serine protease
MRVPSAFVHRWLIVTLTASIISALDGGWLASWAALEPSSIWHGQIWRLVTWPLIEASPLSLIFTCVAIYKFGGELAVHWGDRRLPRFTVEILLAAATVTCALAAVTGVGHVSRLGGWAVADVLAIAWARQFPDRALVLYGLLVLRGREIVRVICAAAIVFAIFIGPVHMAPELVACGAAALYPRSRLRR